MRFPFRSKILKEKTGWLQKFASTRLDSRLADERRTIPLHVFLELGSEGFLGLQVSLEEKGLGLGSLDSLRIMEQIGAIDLSLGACVAVQNFLTGVPIRKHASMRLRKALIADMIAGKKLVAFALTEESAGSDPRRIKATVRRTRNGKWQFTGTKIWSGMAAWASAFVTFAHTFDENDQPLGMTGFAIEANKKGVFCGPETVTMGLRGMVRNRVSFDRVNCDDSCILASVGRGRAVAQETMSIMRLYMAALALGAAKRALQIALRYVPDRQIATGRMAANPVVIEMIDTAMMRIVGMESLLTATAMMVDEGGPCQNELFLACKIVASEWASDVIDTCLQLTGGRGYVEANVLARLYRDIRAFRIIEGPTEALAAHLGGAALLEPDKLTRVSLCAEQARLMAPVVKRLRHRGGAKCKQAGPKSSREASLTLRQQAGLVLAHALAAAATAQFAEDAKQSKFTRASVFCSEALNSCLKTFDAKKSGNIDGATVLRDARGVTESIGCVDETAHAPDSDRDKLLDGQ